MIVAILQSPVDIQPLSYPNSPSPWGPPTPSSLNGMHNVCIILGLLDLHIYARNSPACWRSTAMMRSAKLERKMGVAMMRLLLYHFVGFVHNAMASLFHRSANALQTPMDAVGAQWLPWQLRAASVRAQWKH